MSQASRRNSISRRMFLGGLSAGAAAVPFLRSFEVGAEIPSRPKLVLVGGPNGCLVGKNGGSAGGGYPGWRPDGFSGGEGMLPALLPGIFEPLSRHVDKLLFLEGVAGLPGQGSHRQSASLLTGRPLSQIPGGADQEFTGTGISVDQYVAEQLDSRVLSTAFRIEATRSGEAFWAFHGAEQPVTPIQDPADAFVQVFGDGTDSTEAQALMNRRSAVFDTIAGDLSSLRSRVPAADRERLEAHLDAVATLEKDLLETAALQCNAPSEPEAYDPLESSSCPKVVADHTRIIVQALACGWSRVATLQIGHFAGTFYPQWPELGIDSSFHCHAIAHKFAGVEGDGYTEGLSQNEAVALGLTVETIFHGFLADLLDQLSTTLDADGAPLIDNTLVLFVRPTGTNHNDNMALWIAAGGSGVGVDGGRILEIGSGGSDPRYYNDVLTGVCQSMGLGDESFGEGSLNREPVSFA